MQIQSAADAREWLAAWGSRAFACERIDSLISSQLGCAMLASDRLPATRDGHLAAVAVLRAAQGGGR